MILRGLVYTLINLLRLTSYSAGKLGFFLKYLDHPRWAKKAEWSVIQSPEMLL